MVDGAVRPAGRAPVLAVVSPKGGNGKTTVAVNTAVALARRAPSVLVDLDVWAGDIEYALGEHPVHRLDDLVRKVAGGEPTDVDAMLTVHETGVGALCAPESPLVAGQLTARDTMAAVDRLVALDRPVVIDTGGGIGDLTVGALDLATHVLLVCGTDVSSVHAARKMLSAMAKMALATDRVRLVVNRSTSRLGLTLDDVVDVLGLPASLTIPESAAITIGANRGVPITASAPGSRVSRRFFGFADELLGVDASPTRWWRQWRRSTP